MITTAFIILALIGIGRAMVGDKVPTFKLSEFEAAEAASHEQAPAVFERPWERRLTDPFQGAAETHRLEPEAEQPWAAEELIDGATREGDAA